MNKLLTWCLVLLVTVYPAFSFSMDEEDVSACNCSRQSAECGYLVTYGAGTLALAFHAASKITGIAQAQNHTDPISEGCAAFCVVQAISWPIGVYGYNYCFNSKPQTVPTLEMHKDGPSNTFLKQSNKTHSQKEWDKAIRKANRQKNDRAQKRTKVKQR